MCIGRTTGNMFLTKLDKSTGQQDLPLLFMCHGTVMFADFSVVRIGNSPMINIPSSSEEITSPARNHGMASCPDAR